MTSNPDEVALIDKVRPEGSACRPRAASSGQPTGDHAMQAEDKPDPEGSQP